MTDPQQNQAIYDLLYLAGCAVTGCAAREDRVAGMSLRQVYALSKRHMVTALIWAALEPLSIPDTELAQRFQADAMKALRKNLLLDTERSKLFAHLESLGAWYMPLKGVILKQLYPRQEMRQMSDNDILFDPSYRKAVRDWFVTNGYRVVLYEQSNHDVYEREPVYNYEMHTALFEPSYDATWQRYYGNVKDRLQKDADNQFGYHFSPADFYIYITLHARKHYETAGTGLRSLLDCFVYLNANPELDLVYVAQECEKIGIASFEQSLRTLSCRLFQNPEAFDPADLSPGEAEMLGYIAFSGTYGNQQNHTSNQLQRIKQRNVKHVKLRYLLARLFPDLQCYQIRYPLAYRYRILIPFAWMHRMGTAIWSGRKRLRAEIKTLLHHKKH